jgi:ribonuclease HI
MTPLVIVPARQLSEGRPCKNREHWTALQDCLESFRAMGWAWIVATDDPAIAIDASRARAVATDGTRPHRG